MLVGQTEYRREIWWRFGITAFIGAGQVAPTFTDFKFSNTRPGGGAGLRFVLAPKNHINLRVDFSVGQNSHAWYAGIGGGILKGMLAIGRTRQDGSDHRSFPSEHASNLFTYRRF
jgi:hypothetical protein